MHWGAPRQIARIAVALLLAAAGRPLLAAESSVPPGAGLAAAISAAHPGDVLKLAAGSYDGPVTIGQPITIKVRPAPSLTATDRPGIEVTSPDAVIRGIALRGSGMSLEKMDAAIFLTKGAARALVENNNIQDNLVGIYIHVRRTPSSRITGSRPRPAAPRQIRQWRLPLECAGLPGYRKRHFRRRDGIFTETSRSNVFRGNRTRWVRFAIHYMYTNASEVADNISSGNHAGFVIMYSGGLKVTGNVSEGDRDQGLLLNFANDSLVEGNAIRGATKCVFIYDANKNRLQRNWFEGCRIGVIHGRLERNEITGNAFVTNETQVMYVGTRSLEWSVAGRGNYWSDNPAFDLNGDGIADARLPPEQHYGSEAASHRNCAAPQQMPKTSTQRPTPPLRAQSKPARPRAITSGLKAPGMRCIR